MQMALQFLLLKTYQLHHQHIHKIIKSRFRKREQFILLWIKLTGLSGEEKEIVYKFMSYLPLKR